MSAIPQSNESASARSPEGDAAYLRELIEQARASGATGLRIPPGRYDLYPEHATPRELYVSNTVGDDQEYAAKLIGFLVEGFSDLAIDATGAEFVMHGRQSAIAILDCTDVSLRGLTIDWAVPTVIDITVAATGEHDGLAWRDLTVPHSTLFDVIDNRHVHWRADTSPVTGAPYWTGIDALSYAQLIEPSGRTYRAHSPLFDDVEEVQRTGDCSFRVNYRTTEAATDLGTVYQLRETTRDHPGMLIDNSVGITLSHLTVRFLHGFGLVAQGGESLRLESSTFAPPLGTGRRTAGFADFVHCSGMRGRVAIVDCEFEGSHDDPINVHGTYLAVVGAPGDGVLELEYRHHETAGIKQFALGDTVDVVDRATLATLARGTVREVAQPTGRDAFRPLRSITIRLDGDLPISVRQLATRERLAVENVSQSPEVIVERCLFRGSPTRGILASTRAPVRILDCRFEHIEMACVLVAADANSWWESGPANDVRIERCTFAQIRGGVLQVAPEVVSNAPPVHGHAVLAGNHIELSTPLLADVRSLVRLSGYDNEVTAADPSIREALIVAADPAAVWWLPGSEHIAVRLDSKKEIPL